MAGDSVDGVTDVVAPVLAARALTKSYGAIHACRDVHIELYPGRLTALVGDNGAGKSTVAKIISGAVSPDSGEVLLGGAPVAFADPLAARRAGVEAVYQDLALPPNLDIVRNIFLGREHVRPLFGRLPIPLYTLDTKLMRQRAQEQLDELRIHLPKLEGVPLRSLSGGQRQTVAIARAALWSSRVLVMDEPTAALGVTQSRAVLDVITRVLARGVAVLMISHAMPHVLELADRVVVMRHGAVVANLERGQLHSEDIIRHIVGGSVPL
ncbi:MAG: ATP-binding cassette domain-containing protein [Chloroflexota bacterium]